MAITMNVPDFVVGSTETNSFNNIGAVAPLYGNWVLSDELKVMALDNGNPFLKYKLVANGGIFCPYAANKEATYVRVNYIGNSQYTRIEYNPNGTIVRTVLYGDSGGIPSNSRTDYFRRYSVEPDYSNGYQISGEFITESISRYDAYVSFMDKMGLSITDNCYTYTQDFYEFNNLLPVNNIPYYRNTTYPDNEWIAGVWLTVSMVALYYNSVKYPIIYRPTNCSFPGAPTEAAVGDTVVVPVTFPDGYGLVNESNIYVTNNGVVIPSTYSNGQLTFTMPDPS